MIGRRRFISLLGSSAAATWPLAARAQQAGRTKRIGLLLPLAESDPEMQVRVAAFRKALARLGWTEGQNLRIDYRWTLGEPDRTTAYAAELASLGPDLLMATNPPTLVALRQATGSIPIVFTNVTDPLSTGIVDSLARPSGNVTGFSSREDTLAGKWVELIKEIVPQAARIGVLYNQTGLANSTDLRAAETAASALSVRLTISEAHSADEIEKAMLALSRTPQDGLIVLANNLFTVNRTAIVEMAARQRWPAVYNVRAFVTNGGLLSYGVDVTDLYERAATYVDRILRGAKAGDLPIQQPTKYELIINLKTAKALGLILPPTLLAIADEVIE